nr:hypothetical protein [Capybara microvirus Cap1_SP_76]
MSPKQIKKPAATVFLAAIKYQERISLRPFIAGNQTIFSKILDRLFSSIYPDPDSVRICVYAIVIDKLLFPFSRFDPVCNIELWFSKRSPNDWEYSLDEFPSDWIASMPDSERKKILPLFDSFLDASSDFFAI